MNITRSIYFYNRANANRLNGNMEEAINDYCNAFLDRLEIMLSDPVEFIFFYKNQLLKYLNLKNRVFLSLPEGDMVSDLIKESYDDFVSDIDSSPFCTTEKGRERLLMNMKIVFPVQNDTEEDDFDFIVSK